MKRPVCSVKPGALGIRQQQRRSLYAFSRDASSNVALLEVNYSGAVSNPVMDVTQASVVLLIGANPTVNHPYATFFSRMQCETARSSS